MEPKYNPEHSVEIADLTTHIQDYCMLHLQVIPISVYGITSPWSIKKKLYIW